MGSTGSTQWREQAIDRATAQARVRAERRLERFLDAARELIVERGTLDFTIQELIARSEQSLRNFYQQFEGKQELLLALFEEELSTALEALRANTSEGDPLDRLERVVLEVSELFAPAPAASNPVFAEVAPRLWLSYPEQIASSYSPLLDYLTELLDAAQRQGQVRPGQPRRQAALVLQAVTSSSSRTRGPRALTPTEIWEFCRHAVVPDAAA